MGGGAGAIVVVVHGAPPPQAKQWRWRRRGAERGRRLGGWGGRRYGGTAHVGGRESAAGVLLLTWLRHGGGTFAPSRRPAVSRSANPNPAGQSERTCP